MIHKHQLETSAKNNKINEKNCIFSSMDLLHLSAMLFYCNKKKKKKKRKKEKKKGLQKIDKIAKIKNDTIINFLVAIWKQLLLLIPNNQGFSSTISLLNILNIFVLFALSRKGF